jgi:hypothetical protein
MVVGSQPRLAAILASLPPSRSARGVVLAGSLARGSIEEEGWSPDRAGGNAALLRSATPSRAVSLT